jgi:hypothetical protein
MKHTMLYVPFVIVCIVLVSACGAPMTPAYEIVATEAVKATPSIQPTPMPTQIPQTSGGHALPVEYQRTNRLIIKNVELALLVSDTDTAMDLITQIVADVDGYIVSSRVWYEVWQDESYKHASLTLGVPVVHFETAMRRLRRTAVQVMDESAAGQDVTDEYVDLESRLVNLRAIRDRIREFLDQAEDVEQALKVNAELASVESEIETVQGRMNYLFDRAAYSTISVQLRPEYPPLPTPTPMPLPEPWNITRITKSASTTLVSILQTLAELVVWLGIVVGPFVLPPMGVAWFVWRVQHRKKDAPKQG